MSDRQTTILAIALVVGLFLAGATIGGGLRQVRKSDRYVTVKGLAERDVVADLAIWTMQTSVASDDLVAGQTQLEANVQKIRRFLIANGFPETAIETHGLRVIDKRAREYGEAKAGEARYILESSVVLRSTSVAQVAKVSQMTSDLVRNGVALAEQNACNAGPAYLYTKITDIKTAMLAEATKNARRTAEQFATDSGSRLGGIMQANQGVFSITPRDQVGETGEGGGCAASDPNKKIRVVTTVNYYLEG